MAEDDKTLVGGAGQAIETVANKVEAEAKQATEFASDNIVGRALGYVRALNNLLDEAMQSGLDIKKGTGEIVLREMNELNAKAKEEFGKALDQDK